MSEPAAFPSPGVVVFTHDGEPLHQGAYEGMSLRDHFAAHAPAPPEEFPLRQVQSTVTSHGVTRLIWVNEAAAEREARWRWEYADSMLKARAQ